MSLTRKVKDHLKAGLFYFHKVMLRAGLVVLPNHYYTPIADVRQLSRTRKHWASRAPLHGIDADPVPQMRWLREHVAPFEPEYRGNAHFHQGVTSGYGPGYGYVEAQALYGVVRSLAPKRIIEVGSGVSSYIMLQALEKNEAGGGAGELTCIEPFPSNFLRSANNVKLMTGFVEQLDPAVFDVLEAGDMLFIDSTHAVRPGGDVVYLYLNVIPRLKPGVIIHIHDIYLPYLYQRNVMTALFQWQETVLLAALLTNNNRLKILACLSQLHYDDRVGMQSVFPEYQPATDEDGLNDQLGPAHFPSAIYLFTA